MAGIKSTGQVVSDESNRGQYSQEKTLINFAVPTQGSMANFRVVDMAIPSVIAPGIIHQAISMLLKDKMYARRCTLITNL